jgi:D-alanine-D-alanine ligase
MTSKAKKKKEIFEPKKKLRIIVLVHQDLVPPDSLDGLSDKEKIEIKTEYDVVSTLKKMGHEVFPVGLYNQLNAIGDALLTISTSLVISS